MNRYEFENEGTTGRALDLARRHSVEEIANGMAVPASYLESVIAGNQPVGVILMTNFCRDQDISIARLRRYE